MPPQSSESESTISLEDDLTTASTVESNHDSDDNDIDHETDNDNDNIVSHGHDSQGDSTNPVNLRRRHQSSSSSKQNSIVTSSSSSSDSSKSKSTQNNNINNNNNNNNPFLLFICAFGICTSYLYYGMIQERLFSHKSSSTDVDVSNTTTFMLVLSCMTNVLVAFIWIKFNSFYSSLQIGTGAETGTRTRTGQSSTSTSVSNEVKKELRLNHQLFFCSSFCYFAAMTASNESLGHVSYPTAVLAKSSKLIPTMLVGYFIERKSFLREEVFSATLITIGIIVFNLCKIQQQKEKKRNLNGSGTSDASDVDENNDSTYGLFLLLFSLAMDGFLSSCQNKLKDCGKEIETSPSSSSSSLSKLGGKVEDKKRRQVMYRQPTALETMLWINAYAIVFLLPLSIWSGQFSNGIKMLNLPNPTTSMTTTTSSSSLSIQQTIVVLNLTAATGQIFIFFTIQLFSPLMTTTITTTRKFLTILLSVWKFGHKFTFTQWFSIFMVFSGLYLGIISKFVGGKSTRNGKKYEHKHDLKNGKKSRIRNKQKEKSFNRVKGE